MKMKATLALILAALALLPGTAMSAILLQVDFSTQAGTQAGWESLGGTATGTLNGSFSGYTGLSDGNVTMSVTNIQFNRLYRNGTNQPADDFPGTDLDAMYSDLVFRNNDTGGPIDITITGLRAGRYQITTHHLNAPNTPSRFDLDVQDADSPAFGQSAAADVPMGLGNTTTFNPTVITFDVMSNGIDPIILRMSPTFIGTGGNTGGWWGINGMEILAPEPSTVLLLGLGFLTFLRRRR